MKVNYNDLVAYLKQSGDWHEVPSAEEWIIFEGPCDTDGNAIELVLPSDPNTSDVPAYISMAIATLAAVADEPIDAMANEITPTSVKALLDVIKHFDCEPAVYDVHLVAASHMSGYDATVYFRTYTKGAARSVSTHGDTPEETLQYLLIVLQDQWGPCPCCGQYPRRETKEEHK